MPPNEAAGLLPQRTSSLLSLLPRSCCPARVAWPGTGIVGAPGWPEGAGQAGQEVWKERQQRSIRIRRGVPVATLKGLESEWEPGMTVSRSKLMIM